jgi:plasmid stability protein
METLIIRNVDAELMQRLRQRAVEHGRSVEEEHREILRQALQPQPGSVPDFKSLLLEIPGGDESIFQRR